MAKDTTLGIQVHLNDETKIEANRVPSTTPRDFVSLQLGGSVSILLFNPTQAKALAQAAMNANRILRTIEIDVEEAEMASEWPVYDGYDGEDVYDGDDDEYVECTIEHPCNLCASSY